ncbi:putative AMP-dependent synthetase/ligase, AMP-binding, AMP-binding enzyme domain, ANL [Helianthus annuus]|nr:putative AMP-dependent synthetase/ligase, AMP-binding, AMP-binding enzyme domain, ANL [Helianthus annuus]KAJ0767095.1 putative AMP-dependent synthetase/ligase, AMP-binding, AMP-binding enzyme domain, ANL [Helianthus annuus]
MATYFNQNQSNIFSSQKAHIFKDLFKKNQFNDIPHWYSLETGIYSSKHTPRTLPSDPFVDVVSHIFSQKHNGKTSFIDSSTGFSLSYSELQPLVKSMACGLHHQMGISKGDVVLMLLPNSIHFHIVFLGILYLGAVVTTMNPLCTVSEIKKQTSQCNVKLCFTLSTRLQDLSALGITSIGVPENANYDPNSAAFSCFHQLISRHNNSSLPPRTISQDDPAAILFSSGTTGASKGVVLTHKNLIAGVELFVRFEASQYGDNNEKNTYLAVIPMFHIYGLTLFTLGILSLGSSIVVMNKFDHNEMVRAISKYGVTHFPAVPPLLKALIKVGKSVHRGHLKSLIQVSSGAAPLSSQCIEEFVQTFPHIDFIQGYGLSESTAVGTRGFNTKEIRNYTSIGLLAPNMQAKVVDNITGLCSPPGKTGELWLRGPGIMKEYLKNVEASCSTIDKDGWLHTGDIVYFDHQGYLFIVDRLKDVIKYKGFQIAPADLEDVLVSHPDIDDAVVIGRMDEEAGEIPMAFVVKKPEAKISQYDVIDFVAKQVAPYKKVQRVEFINAIPKSAAGKILRRELKCTFSSRL